MKKLLFLLFICFSFKNFAQTSATSNQILVTYNKYLIKINPSININTHDVAVYMKQICATDLVSFKASTGYFEIYTKKVLEQNIIDGKLQKNATPLSDYIFMGEVKINPSATTNNISTE